MTLDSNAAGDVLRDMETFQAREAGTPQTVRLQLISGGQCIAVCPDERVVLRSGPFWSGYPLEWIRYADSGVRVNVSLPRHRIAYVQRGTSDVAYRARGYEARQRLCPGMFCFASRGFVFEGLEWRSRGLQVVVIDIADFGADPNPIDAYGRTDALFDMSMGIEDRQVGALVDSMCAEITDGCPTGRTYAEALSLALASRVASLCASMPESPRRRPILSPEQVARVRDHIARHLAEDLTIERLARAVNMSPFHFARSFKQATGVSPHKYVTRERVLRAREMLAGGRRSIADIALSLGFSSQSHFADVYRSTTGTSPGRDKGVLESV
jgi:AraC family transcriptional regulator